MNNNFDKVFPVAEDFFESAMDFDLKYKSVIEKIKEIYYNNLDNNEKEMFLEINKNSNDESEEEEENIITFDNISEEEVLKEFIKEYISISMIKYNDNNEYKIVLFIPTENNNIKEQITKYIETTEFKDLLSNIVFGPLDCYNVEENYD
jgi:vacuolar-type H+-ATPase subunit F/Vma7